MPAITHETAPSRHAGPKPAAGHVPAFLGFLRRAAVRSVHLLMQASNAFAEARMHRAMIEAEFYGNRYRHASKNDDELPIVPPGDLIPTPHLTWRRFAGAIVTMAKRAYPAIIVLSLLSTALAATLAIRLAIWLPSRLF
jgi:hypothetical protein